MKIVSIHKNLIILNLYHEYKNNHPSIFFKKVSLEGPLTCCARHILATQDDFKNQKPLLQKLIEARVIFYPKFHCELNYIEMYWGAAKRYVRQHCNYTWKGLQENVPNAFDSIPLKQIRKYAMRASRFMDCYRKGLTVLQAEYIVKKYKSHRRIPDNVLDEIDELN